MKKVGFLHSWLTLLQSIVENRIHDFVIPESVQRTGTNWYFNNSKIVFIKKIHFRIKMYFDCSVTIGFQFRKSNFSLNCILKNRTEVCQTLFFISQQLLNRKTNFDTKLSNFLKSFICKNQQIYCFWPKIVKFLTLFEIMSRLYLLGPTQNIFFVSTLAGIKLV